MRLLRNIRFYVLSLSILLAVGIYAWTTLMVPAGPAQITRLTESYALLALLYLFLSLLPSPLYAAFPSLPYQGQVVKARRALGVSTFLFACCHAYFAFFGQLGGFAGLGFLNRTYLIAISLSFTALLILGALSLTSFDSMVRRLGKWWKRLHRLVYLAGIFILIHALLLGTQFSDPATSWVAQLAFPLLAMLLILEGVRIDRSLMVKVPSLPKLGLVTVVTVGLISLLFRYLLPSTGSTGIGFNIHAQHIQLAKQAQQGGLPSGLNLSTSQLNSPPFAGLRGDPTRRFTVSFGHPETVAANQDTPLSFQVYDANSGNLQTLYTKVYSKFIHLVIVDGQLQYFSHLHPDFKDDEFVITTQFPHDGIYHLYVDYQPFGAIEQQQAFTLKVGSGQYVPATQPPDSGTAKTFGNYEVSMSSSAPLKASELSIGNQTISFTIKDAATGQPVTTLKPYLEAYGHLVMINEQSYDYLHVHPNDLTVPMPDQNGGPTVTFLPLGLYGPIKPGTYRLFAEFNPAGNLFVATFTVKIQ